jgi:exopolysaccharide biosynthesis polyprenyl glycosylphosphotransferase
MVGRKQQINIQLSQVLDCVLIAVAFWLSYVLRDALTQIPLGKEKGFWIAPSFLPSQIPDFTKFFWVMAIAVPITPLLLEMHGYYSHPLQKTFRTSFRQMAWALLWIVLIVAIFAVFLKWEIPSRAVLLLFVLVAGGLLLLKEAFVKTMIKRSIASGDYKERVVFAGTPEDVDRLLGGLNEEHKLEMEIVDTIDISTQPMSDLVEALHEKAVERVIFATAHAHFDTIQEGILACETEGVEAWLNAEFIETAIARPSFDALGSKLMLVFRSTPDASWGLLLKAVFDRVGAAFLILATSPLWLVAAIGIKRQSPGAVFFSQKRSGRYGKQFEMYKFRTMYVDAEKRRAALTGENEMDGPVFKIENDPRIFPFGSWLRKRSVDELPQLINVLRGEMSLVGPRPLPVYEVEQIAEVAQRRRLSVRPGLTCLWQVSGRNKITSFEEWVALDLKYIDNWSLWLDIRILARTVPVVLFGSGAR